MKKAMSLLLALVMCVGLAVPAFAAAVPPAAADAAPSAEAVTPRYAVYDTLYTIDLENNTYAGIIFTIAEKNGNVSFEKGAGASISFSTTNPNGSHWKIVEHHYSISETEFKLFLKLQDMEGDTPSSSWLADAVYTVLPIQVAWNHSSSQNTQAVLLAPDSVDVSFDGEMCSTQLADAVLLTPDSVHVTFGGKGE